MPGRQEGLKYKGYCFCLLLTITIINLHDPVLFHLYKESQLSLEYYLSSN